MLASNSTGPFFSPTSILEISRARFENLKPNGLDWV